MVNFSFLRVYVRMEPTYIPELICRGALSFVFIDVMRLYRGICNVLDVIERCIYIPIYRMLYHHHDRRVEVKM